jgi:DNA modification methylase
MGKALTYLGDALEVLPLFAADSFDSIVTDPPSGVVALDRAKPWDGDRGGRDQWVNWLSAIVRQGWRCLRPGGWSLFWALPKTAHWTALAIEDAGFEVKDCVVHHFGSGFPTKRTLLKPGSEFWILARKPGRFFYELRIDDCRVGDEPRFNEPASNRDGSKFRELAKPQRAEYKGQAVRGRWPANGVFTHDARCGADRCVDGCPVLGLHLADTFPIFQWHEDDFVCCPKAPKSERIDAKHPTPKSIEMMRWLIRLITPSGGRVLDFFMGSGSGGVAALREGFDYVGVEQDPEYWETARQRLVKETFPISSIVG